MRSVKLHNVAMPKRRSAAPRTPFASRLIRVREAFATATNRPDMGQKEFARLLGFGDGQEETYRRYERGETEPPIRTLAEIRRVTGTSLDMLITGEGDKARELPKRIDEISRVVRVHRHKSH